MAYKQLIAVPGALVYIATEGTTVSEEHDLSASVVNDRRIPFVFRSADQTILLQGDVQDRVAVSKDTKRLHFSHRVRLMPGGSKSIMTVTRTGFPDGVSVGWRLDGLGKIQPHNARRDGLDVGKINFEFTGSMAPSLNGNICAGDESRFFYIKTEAVAYASDGETILMLNTGQRLTIQASRPTVLPPPD